MSSLWARERAEKLIVGWNRRSGTLFGLPPTILKELQLHIAEAIEEAEQYGENRYKEQDDE